MTDLRSELDEAWDHVATLTKALTGLSGGGSEFFIYRRGHFIADAPLCVARVRARERVLHDQLQRLAREKRDAVTEAERLSALIHLHEERDAQTEAEAERGWPGAAA